MSTPTKSSVAEDVEIVRRILAHIDAGTTDEGDAWREPVENYLDPGRFTERTRDAALVSERVSTVGGDPRPRRPRRTGQLRRAAVRGAGPRRSGAGVPQRVPASRDGARRGPGCAHALVCRYHGWTYRLDGSLSHVPHADAFPDLDAATRGLVEVDSREVDGLIVIGPLQPSSRRTHADEAMAALTDGSPWRDKLLPAERLVLRRLHCAADELEGARRAVPRGLPHPLDAQEHLLPDSVRRPQRRRTVRPEQPNHVPVPEHRATARPPGVGMDDRPARDVRLPPVPERHARDVPGPGAGGGDRPGRRRPLHGDDLRHGDARGGRGRVRGRRR